MHENEVDYPTAYTHVKGSNDAEIAQLVKWLDVPVSRITIVGPGKRNLDRSRSVQSMIAAGATAQSTRQHRPSMRANVLALWLDDDQLGEIEESHPARLAVAPWLLDKIALWRLARNPTEVSGAAVPIRPPMDPVVRAAMDTVAMLSNPNNGCNSYNRDYAVHAFRKLRSNKHVWDPIDTAVVMVKRGWRLDDAGEFATLAADMLAGKGLHAGPDPFARNILKTWRDEANSST